MVKEGYYFGLPPLVLGVAALIGHFASNASGHQGEIASGVFLISVALFVFYFFRDPERSIPTEPGALVSPADGRIVVITDEPNNGIPGKRVSIFLAIWNVHVNRSPEAGTITAMEYRPGKFLAAMVARASAENEQNVISLSTAAGEMMFKQIAGLIARRVVCWKKRGDVVARGERIGLVRFGSRVDLWVPRDAEILVKLGDNVKGGSSVLARWPANPNLSKQQGSNAAAVENLTATGNLR
jgi:phosphatidylserine decarboxylase